MADIKISGLPAVSTPALTDEFEVNQAGVSRKITRAQMLDHERYMLRADAARTLASVTTEQAIFNNPTNGRLTVPVGVYRFEMLLYVTGLSATSGNFAIDPLGAGTAVCGAWLYQATGIDSTTPTAAAAQTGSTTITQQTVASVVTAGTGTAAAVRIEGTFEVTTAGTMIPSLTLVTASAGSVAIGSYFWAERISSSTTLVSIGPAD